MSERSELDVALNTLELNNRRNVVMQDCEDYYYLTSKNTVKIPKVIGKWKKGKLRLKLTEDNIRYSLTKKYQKSGVSISIETGVCLKEA